MNVKKAIEARRDLRSLSSFEVSVELVDDLAKSASLAQSCFNI